MGGEKKCILCLSKIRPLHAFPTDGTRRKKWINVLRLQEDQLVRDPRICSKHFSKDDYTDLYGNKTNHLRRTATPFLNEGYEENADSIRSTKSGRKIIPTLQLPEKKATTIYIEPAAQSFHHPQFVQLSAQQYHQSLPYLQQPYKQNAVESVYHQCIESASKSVDLCPPSQKLEHPAFNLQPTAHKNDHQDPHIQPSIHLIDNYTPHLHPAQQSDHHASAQQFEHNSSAQLFNHHAPNLQPAVEKNDYQDTLIQPLVKLVDHDYHAVHQDEYHTPEKQFNHHDSYLQPTAQQESSYNQLAGHQDYNGNFASHHAPTQQINKHSSYIVKQVDHRDPCIQSVVQLVDHNYFAPSDHQPYIEASVKLMDDEKYAPPLQPSAQQVNQDAHVQTFNHHASNIKLGAQEVDNQDPCIQSVVQLVDHNYFAPSASQQVDNHSYYLQHAKQQQLIYHSSNLKPTAQQGINHYPNIQPSVRLMDDEYAPPLQPVAQQIIHHAPAQHFKHHASNLKSGAAQEVDNQDPDIQPAVQLVDLDAPYVTSDTKQGDKKVPENCVKQVNNPDHYSQLALQNNLKGSMPLKISKGSQTRQKKKTKSEEDAYLKEVLGKKQLEKFTIDKIINPKRKRPREYSKEEICRAYTLRAISAKAHNLSRKEFGLYGIPSRETLDEHTKHLKVRQGYQHQFMEILKQRIEAETDEHFKHCVLVLDEMAVEQKYEYDIKDDFVMPPKKEMLVCIARGLYNSWKQVIFIDFDIKIDKKLVLELIDFVQSNSGVVRGVVFDNGNQKLLSDLRISNACEPEHFMINPRYETRKIYYFPDVPHCIKLFRNHILDYGISIYDEHGNFLHSMGWKDFNKLINREKEDVLKLTNLTMDHISVKGLDRQKVNKAAQLLSARTGKAFLHVLGDEYKKLSETIIIISKWFDTFQSKSTSTTSNPLKNCFGTEEQVADQIKAIEDMNTLMTRIKFNNKDQKKKQAMKPFMKGIIAANKSLLALFQEVKREDGFSYLFCCRLQQDVLESQFGVIRLLFGYKFHPTPLECLHRWKVSTIAKDVSYLLDKSKVNSLPQQTLTTDEEMVSHAMGIDVDLVFETDGEEGDDDQSNILEQGLKEQLEQQQQDEDKEQQQQDEDKEQQQQDKDKEQQQQDKDKDQQQHEHSQQPTPTTSTSIEDRLQSGELKKSVELYALNNIAGYIVRKMPHYKGERDSSSLNEWINSISWGKLSYPKSKIFEMVYECNKLFVEYHGGVLDLRLQNTVMGCLNFIMSKNPNFDIIVVKKFLKTRTYASLKLLNANYREEKRKKNKSLRALKQQGQFMN